jgi:transforming growth factor-beta-induced protein
MLLTLTASTALALAPLATDGSHTIVDTAKRAGGFETLLAAVDTAGLTETLMGTGPFTVFAPNDAAFTELGHTVNDLLKPENRGLLTDILTYHVVPGEFQAADVLRRNNLGTVNGQRLNLGLLEGDLFVQNAQVIATDVDASNGVIHVIDTVMQPTSDNLVEVAAGAGKFELLLAAAQAAGLVESLVGEGPYTVLAPTDEAFRALGSQLDDLLKPENRGTLRRILSYHVIPGRAYADQASASTPVA